MARSPSACLDPLQNLYMINLIQLVGPVPLASTDSLFFQIVVETCSGAISNSKREAASCMSLAHSVVPVQYLSQVPEPDKCTPSQSYRKSANKRRRLEFGVLSLAMAVWTPRGVPPLPL